MGLKYIAIGGSAGSFEPTMNILSALPKDFKYPVFVCLHRPKHVRNAYTEALSIKSKINIDEAYDNQPIIGNNIYIAPANYHIYFEKNNRISLSVEQSVNYSRPSIDLCFYSAAQTFKSKLISILLSGANCDGAFGMRQVKENGGITIIQNPNECEVNTMVNAALKETKIDYVYTINEITEYLLNID